MLLPPASKPAIAPYDIAVVIPTYNRGAGLPAVLQPVLDQDAPGITYEVVVVDNNSSDRTRAVVEALISQDTTGRLRYAFEPRQGVSYARNTGVELTTAPIILFLDDDGVPGRDWVRSMKAAFDAHPEADCIAGRVKAEWPVPPPSWMGPPHMGPIAIQDRADATYVSRGSASMCLLTANLGIRREVFARIGGFSPAYPRGQDREFELRMWRAGMRGLYLPSMDVVVPVPGDRLTRTHHRRWQATTARYHARMRFRDCVDAKGVLHDEPVVNRTLLGTPLFLYREFLTHVIGWLGAALTFRSDRRFFHETRLWYYVSFLATRMRDLQTAGSSPQPENAIPSPGVDLTGPGVQASSR
jgi:glycosyltransferase involved in cell wall biosynthesis